MDAPNMRQMVEAPKDRTPILAKIRDDLGAFFPHYGFGGPDEYAGRFVVVHHPGLAEDGFDIGWSLSGPFGHGLGTDAVFAGWWPLPGSVPATEHDRLMAEKDAEIAAARDKALDDAARMVDCSCECRDAVLAAKTKVDRWNACGRDPCGALDAAEIRALKESPDA